MTRYQARPQRIFAGVAKRYRVTSPAGVAAVRERIRDITAMSETATLGSSKNIWQSVILMLNTMLEADAAGVTTRALLEMIRAQFPLSYQDQEDAMRILNGNMDLVREAVSGQAPKASSEPALEDEKPVVRQRGGQGTRSTTHSIARTRLESSKPNTRWTR